MHRLIAAMIIFTMIAGITVFQAGAADVVVDGEKRYQTIEGFGTCLVAWVRDMQNLYRTEAFQRTYAEGVNFNILRVNMWGPTFEKPTEDWTRISYKDFDFSANGGRPQIFVDFGQGIRKINPDVKIIGTVWSPPAWMKMNKSITYKRSGAIRANSYEDNPNRVDPKYFKHFCKWMVEYVKYHDEHGVDFYAVSPGNEIQFSQSFESCIWTGEDFATIVAMLGDMLEEEGYGHVKIFGPETMTSHLYTGGTGSYVDHVKQNEAALKALDVWATHGYEDGVKAEMSATSSRQFWEIIKDTDKPFWITEGGTGGHDWPAPIQKGVGTAIHNALVAGNCSAFVPWQIAEKKKSTHGLMVMNDYTDKTYTAMHYSKFIAPGAQRVDATPGFGDLLVGAFHHPDSGVLTIVVINPGQAEQDLNLTLKAVPGVSTLHAFRTGHNENLKMLDDVKVNDNNASVRLPGESIVTLTSGESK
ncbi:MAG: glycoside hydrolase family 30 beta sandwich domain-containing protein [Candidatus Sumerlaeia bacterium]